MGLARFRCKMSSPPGGVYEYAVGDKIVTDRYMSGIAAKAKALRIEAGLPAEGDCFRYVMDYMCPRLPDGFCTTPSTVKYLQADKVKLRTIPLFSLPCATADVVDKRLMACVACPHNIKRGFCVTCTGLLTWVYRGFGGRRPGLPGDQATGACAVDEVMVAAAVSVDGAPLREDAVYPPGCWRDKEGVTANGQEP